MINLWLYSMVVTVIFVLFGYSVSFFITVPVYHIFRTCVFWWFDSWLVSINIKFYRAYLFELMKFKNILTINYTNTTTKIILFRLRNWHGFNINILLIPGSQMIFAPNLQANRPTIVFAYCTKTNDEIITSRKFSKFLLGLNVRLTSGVD